MTAEPVTVDRPLYPLPECTDFELRVYRRDLERAIQATPEHEIMTTLRAKLADVLAEEPPEHPQGRLT